MDSAFRNGSGTRMVLLRAACGCLAATVLLFAATPAPARLVSRAAETKPAAAAPASQPAEAARNLLPWSIRFADALDTSRRSRAPIIVDVGADWCVWCRELDKEIATDAVQQKLGKWTRLRLDADRDADAIHNLAVGPLPALRVLSPSGQVLAWHNGYMKADELVAWLDAHTPPAEGAPPAELEASGAPDAVAVDRLVQDLTDRDPLVHQAAVRRLMPYPNESATKVAAAFADGKLRQRLAARELLAAWKAPVETLDPWKPETITPPALDALKAWAATPHTAATAATLSAEDLGIARHDIATMLQTSDPSEVDAARERLARFGAALLPEVYAGLKSAATDRDRERLTALRYRAVATDVLALHWPGGFDRLASQDARVRHEALDELGKNLSAADSPLLMELFSDPDALMRETSLRLLQSVGGTGTSGGIVRLLHDPEPNVRAAVLKQLTESPDLNLVPEVVKYLATEKDPDMLVHGIRFLREAKGRPSTNCLLSLLTNASWRVRAEAAEALGAGMDRNSGTGSQTTDADIYAAMIKLLDDPDGFVVSRALGVLAQARVPSTIKAMAKVPDKRPELAPDVVKALGSQSNDEAAQSALRRFSSHKDAGVRTAALAALGTNASADEFIAALQDPVVRVRIAGAKVVNELLEGLRPDSRRSNLGQASTVDAEAWLKDFRSGKGRPDWAAQAVEPLRKMLHSDDGSEKIFAAIPLAALGDDKDAVDFLRHSATEPGADRAKIASALRWLPWDRRVELFTALRSVSGDDPQMLGVLAASLAEVPSEKAADALWGLLSEKAANIATASAVERSLIHAYLGVEYWAVQQSTGEGPARKDLIDTSKKMAAEGSALQRVVALALLLRVSTEDAAASSQALLDSGAGGDGLRTIALQVILLSQSREDGTKTAISFFSASPPLRKTAISYLAAGAEPITNVQGEMALTTSNSEIVFRTLSANSQFAVKAPDGLTREMLEPMLKDGDPEVVAYAGYLLCVLGDRRALDSLIQTWRDNRDNTTWRRLTYRAIAIVGDDELTPVLDEIYATYRAQAYEVSDFYWTVRVMKGPQVLKLRKRVRDEVGMERLRE